MNVLLRYAVLECQASVEVECKVGNKYQIMMSVQLSLHLCWLHPYIITLYHFCGAFVHLHMGSSDFLSCRRGSSLSVSLSRAKIESHLIYWPCPQLHKIMAFGEQVATLRPLSLSNRTSFHRSDLAAKVHWQRDVILGSFLSMVSSRVLAGAPNPTEISSENQHQVRSELRRARHGTRSAYDRRKFPQSLTLTEGLFPFLSTDFGPAINPRKALVMGKIQLTAPSCCQS